jgi:hypothetical protein
MEDFIESWKKKLQEREFIAFIVTVVIAILIYTNQIDLGTVVALMQGAKEAGDTGAGIAANLPDVVEKISDAAPEGSTGLQKLIGIGTALFGSGVFTLSRGIAKSGQGWKTTIR